METFNIGKRRYYSIRQTEALTGMKRAALYKRIARGKLDALKIGRFLFVDVKTVKALEIERLKGEMKR